MHREELIRLLDDHHPQSVAEAGNVARARHFVAQHPDCFHRELLHGHVTGSAWVVNPTRDKVLLMHHRKHNEWFQPGGHADGNADILRVALRETHEETGIPAEHIKLVDGTVFDVDIHTIPAIGAEPRHTHFDIRFLLEIDDRLPVPGNDESHEVLWVPVYEASRFNNNLSTYRMVDKTRRLRSL
jgi:8-oxo-dGTP pyrophosphatase MutT (NUDIX family)